MDHSVSNAAKNLVLIEIAAKAGLETKRIFDSRQLQHYPVVKEMY